MDNEVKTRKKGISLTTKWIITAVLFVLAVVTVILCVKGGNFSFKPGSVQPHDDPVEETAAPEEKDDDVSAVTHRVLITAGNGGSADPSGSVSVEDWGSVSVNFIPNEGYEVQSVKVDGEDKGAIESYTLSYIKDDHTIIATFQKKPEPTPTPTPDDILAGLEDILGNSEN